MANVRIILNLDKELDGISPESEIALTFAAAKFNSLVSRGGTLSNRFKLVKTANNKRQLSILDENKSNSNKPYLLYDVRIIVDNVPIYAGLSAIEESSDYYYLRVFSGVTNFFKLIGDKTINQLDLSTYNHKWTSANVQAARQNLQTDGYVYPNINYGRWTGQSLGNRPHTDFFPAVYFRTILEKAATEEGYTLQNYVSKRAIPFCLQDFEAISAVACEAESTANQTLTINNAFPEDELAEFSNEVTNPLGLIQQDTIGIKNYTDIFTRPGSIKLTATISYTRGAGSVSVNLGIYRTPKTALDVITVAPNTSGTYTFEVNEESDAVLSRYVVAIEGAGVGETLQINTGSNFRIETGRIKILSGDVIPIADTLPDIKIKDLFLYEAVRSNSLIITDPINKTIEFVSINSIANKKVIAKDWSNKVDTLIEPKYEYRITDYAQNNYLQYKDGSDEDPAYSANNNLGRGNFQINDTTLKIEREWFTSVFAASGKSLAFNGEPPLIRLPRYSTTSLSYDEPDLDPVEREVIIDVNNSFLINLSGESPLSTQANATFEGFDVSVLRTEDYQALNNMFNKMKLVEVYTRLNVLDIQKLDITVPVYILGNYWFIREVQQFRVTDQQSTKVKLIRL